MVKKNSGSRILSGLRVMDFTDALSGPFCTRYLADCGCDVINIERPEGKVARSLPYFQDGYSAEYMQNHTGKKSFAIDLKAKGARELMLKLAEVSDIVVENYRPGVMQDFGLDYESLKAVNPSIIMCSISGWGQTGPFADRMGVDLLIQASRASAYLASPAGERPRFASFAVSDILAGLNAFSAISVALYKRAVTGQGEYIDIGMGDCLLTALSDSFGTHILSKGKAEYRSMAGSFAPGMSPVGAYKGRDGYLTIFGRTDLAWERLTEIMGKPELASDPRFSTIAARVEHNGEVTAIIDEWLQNFDRVADVAALLQSYRILSAPVLTMKQVIEEDPQTQARNMIVDIQHPTLGPHKFVNTPLRFKNWKAGVEEPPPVAIGEHTDQVLRMVLKLNKADIKKLRQDKVVFGPEDNNVHSK